MDTLLVNREKYNELKAKAELYDAVLKEHIGMLGCRGSSFYHDFVGFMETLKTAKLGKLTLYISRAGELVIMPKEMYIELTKGKEHKNEARNILDVKRQV